MFQNNRRQFLRAALGAGGSLGLGGVAWLACQSTRSSGPHIVKNSGHALGTKVSITAVHANRRLARRAVDAALAELARVEEVMSLYRDDSQLCRLNRHATLDDPHPDLVEVLQTAASLSRRTEGAFDVTVGPLWRLYADTRARGRLPDDTAVAAAARHVDWRRVEVDHRRVRLQESGTAVTLNGIAQGFATDRATDVLRRSGIEHALIDAGEIGSLGVKPSDESWVVGIRHPRRQDAHIGRVALTDRAMATSGDYATSFSPGHEAHHLFDPRTGRSPCFAKGGEPATNVSMPDASIASVSVVAPSAMRADALSTALFILGVEKGLALVAQTPRVDALFVFKDGRTLATPGFPDVV